MPMKKFPIVVAATVFSLATVSFAGSHLSPEQQGAMNARQSHMGLYGFNLGALGGMAQDKIPYDADVAAAAAANLAALASIDTTRYWVEGTDSSVEGSRAKAEIWSDRDGYMAEEMALASATTALAAVAGDGLDAMKAAFGPVGRTCGSCHEAYRAPRN